MSERARRWPWVVGAVALALALVVAVMAEPAARWLITTNVQKQVREAVGLDDDHPVDVEFTGGAVAALISREIPGMSITAADVPLGELAGEVRVELAGVTFDGDVLRADGTAWITPASLKALLLQRLLALVDDADELGDAVSLEVDEPYLVVGTSVTVLGLTIPLDLAMSVQPAVDVPGSLFVWPSELRLDGHRLSADEILSTFDGALADVFDGWVVCIADGIPRGLTITSLGMVDGRIEVGFTPDVNLLTDATLRQPGTC